MKIKNFTPLFDQLTQATDILTSAVYGRIWRYEQGEYKKCSAAVKTIARELGISEKTVERRIKTLEEMGFIEDLTPNRRHAPHDYVTTGLIDITLDGTSESLTSQSESPLGTSESLIGQSESPSKTVRESVKDTIKIQIKKENKKEENIYSDSQKENYITVLSKVTGLDAQLNKKKLANFGKKLFNANWEAELIDRLYSKKGVWYTHDWRGEKGQSPNIANITETLNAMIEALATRDGPKRNEVGEIEYVTVDNWEQEQ